jgi:fructosamine-3-kinase
MNFWKHVEQAISEEIGEPFIINDHQGTSGGCINESWIITGDKREFFIKSNRPERLEMFVAEAEGLKALADTGAIRVPAPVCWGSGEDRSYLVMESIRMGGAEDSRLFGQQLAQMHLATKPQYGWYRGNTIGSTAQVNGWLDDWIEFWRHQRLGYQLILAKHKGIAPIIFDKGELIKDKFPALFAGRQVKASPLHGDLWSGNWSGDANGNPVIFDPAFYYGDHEADLAMMELFGSPGRGFLNAYREVFPVDPGYPVRRHFYNLYHILNHFNLFGGGYAGQAERLMDKLLAELL